MRTGGGGYLVTFNTGRLRPEVQPFEQKEKTNSGYKHNNKVSHGTFNLTSRMLQHTSSKSDEI